VGIDKTSGAGTVTVRLKKLELATGTVTEIDTDSTSTTASGQILSMGGLTEDVNGGFTYWVQVEGGGTTGDVVHGAQISYTRP
jgi:hypothetical protein